MFTNLTNPYPLGVHAINGSIKISFHSCEMDCGIILYDRNDGKEIERIPFLPEERIGNIYTKYIKHFKPKDIAYLFYENDQLVTDKYTERFFDKSEYSSIRKIEDLKAVIEMENFKWGEDRCPKISKEQSVIYVAHMRGFTQHPSSKVRNKGTFRGMQEKLDYLLELGITTIEVQPIYDFMEHPLSYHFEMQNEKKYHNFDFSKEKKPNYWGYIEGYYYVPKSAYAATNNPIKELKDLVKQIHINQQELIMQMYFPPTKTTHEIVEILKFWKLNYHVDGFHLMGPEIPILDIAKEPLLADSKLWYQEMPIDKIYENTSIPVYKNISLYQDDYMYKMRGFLKGDEGMLPKAAYYLKRNDSRMGVINYFTNFFGFTLHDLVSYDRKHNEANGEENQDGNDYNHSWNCGIEGTTAKKNIKKIRKQQIRNAITMLFLSQGIPLIFMGDEFCNSQEGNNNPYCQDNKMSWLNWEELKKNNDIYRFTKAMIDFRKQYDIFHLAEEPKQLDYLSCGYPDFSLHGEFAWKQNIEHYNRHFAIMLCGKYAKECKDKFFYIVFNMHWESHKFFLPKLPKDLTWNNILDTSQDECNSKGNSEGSIKNKSEKEAAEFEASPRTVSIFISNKIVN